MPWLVTGCATLPPPKDRVETTALTDTAGTRLGRAVAPGVAANPGKTGIHSLPDPRDAFAARVLLANAAEKSLDAQYYIWHGDQVGYLLFEALWQAAERGVRVRLLLDDLNTAGLDPTIAVLDAHPNIEVRLYNPLVSRDARVLNFVTDFTRVNRRMHNKSFTVDNQVTVVGGRNIANEYFGAGTGLTFADLDVLAVGSAVRRDIQGVRSLLEQRVRLSGGGFRRVRRRRTAPPISRPNSWRTAPIPNRPRISRRCARLRWCPSCWTGQLALAWADAEVVYDDPAKTLDTTERTDVLLFPELVRKMGPAGEDAGHRLAVLHTRRRRHRATGGASETRRNRAHSHQLACDSRGEVGALGLREAPPGPAPGRCPALRDQAVRGEGTRESKARFGSGASSGLHAKTLAVDSRRIFVGSFNFDPRSARLNTEMGLVIGNPVLAQGLTRFFDVEVPMLAYEVRLAADGNSLEWIERTASGEKHYDTEPEIGLVRAHARRDAVDPSHRLDAVGGAIASRAWGAGECCARCVTTSAKNASVGRATDC